MNLAFELAIIAFLIILNGWFAMSELAIVSSRRARLQALAAEGKPGAQHALRLSENPGRFFSSVQVGITLVGVLTGAYSGATLAEQMTNWLAEMAIPEPFSTSLSMAVVVGGITYATLILGELVPKQIALAAPERVAMLVAGPMMGLARLASPLVTVMEASSMAVLTLLRVRRSSEQTVTEEEVKAMIAEGTENGVFQPQEQELLSGVMRFGNRKIRAVMTPRSEMVSIDLDWPTERIMRTLLDHPYSRYPAYRGKADDIIGVLAAKNLLDQYLTGQPTDLDRALQPIPVLPDTAHALHCVDSLKASPIHMALVVDEYGCAQGLVTATDILSSIIGSLHEHGEASDEGVVRQDEQSWVLDGLAAIDTTAELTGCTVMGGDSIHYSTVAGFVLAKLRRIPAPGDAVEWDEWRFEVLSMDGRRIERILLTRMADGIAENTS